MKWLPISLILVLLTAALTQGQGVLDKSNPYSNAKVGDWAKYESVSKSGFEPLRFVNFYVVTKVEKNIVEVSVRKDLKGKESFSYRVDQTLSLIHI